MKYLLYRGIHLSFILYSVVILSAQAPSDFDLERVQRATVFILQAKSTGDDLVITCVGSGVVVSSDGLILSNAHHTVFSEVCPGDTLIISMTTQPGSPPIPKYRATISQVDIGLDLALLRVDRELDGRLIERNSLPPFPFVELADSSDVLLDDTITVVGYPDIGNNPATEARGTVTAFLAEPSGGTRSWMKTSAAIPGTMSGAGAYNRDGRLIGIPTIVPLGITASDSDCRLIDDTNRDGIINNNDSCLPIGDFINTLRPSNFARPLIRSASLGLTVENLSIPNVQPTLLDAPQFGRLFFAPSVSNSLPSTIVGSLPAGTNSLFLFFDYENMSPNTIYELRVTIDGIPNQLFSLPPVPWSGGERGLWYIGSVGQPWPNGNYEFQLRINGVAAGSQRIIIGGAAQSTPSFSNLIFGLQDLEGNLIGNGYVLPTGSIASARFIYQNMENTTPWTVLWYYNGAQIARTDDLWQDGANGSKTVSLLPDGGLFPGSYRVELYINARLSATSDFVIAGAQEGAFPIVFVDPYFVSASSPFEATNATPTSTFPDQVGTLYTVFDWQQLFPGTLWTMRWSVDNEVFFEQTDPWVATESGIQFLTRLVARDGIPDGTYTFDLFVNNVQLASTTAEVGIGQLPIDSFSQDTGIQLRGRIVDSETQQGLAGVTFILISEDFSVEDFTWDQEQIYALATTDRGGSFEFDRLLEIDTPYSVLIATDGYLPISADGFIIESGDTNPIEVLIPMTRD